MPDYKELYLKLFRASEKAIELLIQAQRECEELYISQPGPDIRALARLAENSKRHGGMILHAFLV